MDPITLPPPYVQPFRLFQMHYFYHQARSAGCRPSLGRLAMTSGLSRDQCRRYRRAHEAMVAEMTAREVQTPAPADRPGVQIAIPKPTGR